MFLIGVPVAELWLLDQREASLQKVACPVLRFTYTGLQPASPGVSGGCTVCRKRNKGLTFLHADRPTDNSPFGGGNVFRGWTDLSIGELSRIRRGRAGL